MSETSSKRSNCGAATLPEYIAKINELFSPPLSETELRWARNAWDSGISAQRFAGWLILTAKASSPLLLNEDQTQ